MQEGWSITEEQADWAIIFFTSLAHHIATVKIKNEKSSSMNQELSLNDAYTVQALSLLVHPPVAKC